VREDLRESVVAQRSDVSFIRTFEKQLEPFSQEFGEFGRGVVAAIEQKELKRRRRSSGVEQPPRNGCDVRKLRPEAVRLELHPVGGRDLRPEIVRLRPCPRRVVRAEEKPRALLWRQLGRVKVSRRPIPPVAP